MDDNRLQSYLNLIQSLLNSRSGEEMELLEQHSELVDLDLIEVMQADQILRDNSQLLDAGFLQACEAVAAIWAQQGEENNAN